jgi:hypothetical protein
MEFLKTKLASVLSKDENSHTVFLCLKINEDNTKFFPVQCAASIFVYSWLIKNEKILNNSIYKIFVNTLDDWNKKYISGIELSRTIDDGVEGTLLIQSSEMFSVNKVNIQSFEGIILSYLFNIPLYISSELAELHCVDISRLEEKHKNEFINEVINVEQ